MKNRNEKLTKNYLKNFKLFWGTLVFCLVIFKVILCNEIYTDTSRDKVSETLAFFDLSRG